MNSFRRKTIYFIPVCLILILGEFLSSRYGTNVIFRQYPELSFKFQIENYGATFNIFNPDGDCYLVHSERYFPSGRRSKPSPLKDDEVFIKEILAFCVFDSSLLVSVKSLDERELLIKIKSTYPEEGFLKEYEFIEKESLKNIVWNQLDRNLFLSLQLNWSKIFWILIILSILFFYFFKRDAKSPAPK
ncbi:MAG: hypothetical protein ACPGVD_12650 [Flavobacteriales bacterium]